ncbi:MAG TPA: hypothetical protein VEC06_20340 [Paucimonas sp.]|nr:hypothetical protein [Paucimonas sp.]
MEKKKILQYAAAVIFCAVAIWIGLNSKVAMAFIWHVWHGRHLHWNGVDVELSNRQYFAPSSDKQAELFIGDWKSRDATIVLHRGNRTREFQKFFVTDFCRLGECQQMNEQSYMVNKRRVDTFSFTKRIVDSEQQMFHQYLVISDANIWIEFFGNQNRYADHKSMIDSLVQKIAKQE